MKTKSSLLSPESIAALRDDYLTLAYPEPIIEFLGHMSYCASCINNSKNPKKAAKTLMEKEKILKIFEKWLYAKTHPKPSEHECPDEAHAILDKYSKLLPPREEERTDAAALAAGAEE